MDTKKNICVKYKMDDIKIPREQLNHGAVCLNPEDIEVRERLEKVETDLSYVKQKLEELILKLET